MKLAAGDLVLCSGTLPPATPWSDRLAAASAAGFRGISVWGRDHAAARRDGLSDADLRVQLDDRGLADAEIAAVARVSLTSWAGREAALLQAADELVASADVSDSTWQELAGHFDPPALVEILFVVGQYTMLSMVANAAGIDAPEGGDRIP